MVLQYEYSTELLQINPSKEKIPLKWIVIWCVQLRFDNTDAYWLMIKVSH